MPSFGNFGVASEVQYYFGFPRTIGFPGLQMDIDRVAESTVSKDSSATTRVAFVRALGGQYSAHEHLIPERFFTNASDPLSPQAVSAIKAIALAASEGQRVYTLNNENRGVHTTTITQLNLDAGVKREISNALAAGKEVTAHQEDINYAGFNGSGYIITDPETGAAAFKISTGASGARLAIQQLANSIGFVSVAAAADDNQGAEETLRFLIDVFFNILVDALKLVIAGILYELLALLEQLLDALPFCSGAELIFVMYVYIVLTVLTTIFLAWFIANVFVLALATVFIQFLIGAFLNEVVIPTVCQSGRSARKAQPQYAIV